ncbi:MAG: DUF2017 family protein [Actinomycetota bacterium]
MAEIEPSEAGAVRLRLEVEEAGLLKQLLGEMRTLLDADVPRSDPVIERLFPDAHDEAEQAQAYRDLVETELRAGKLNALEAVEQDLPGATRGALSLPADHVEMWLTSLTDMRLAIGTRLEATEELMAADLDTDAEDAPALNVMHWLGWLQEMMVRAITEQTEGPE